MKKIALLLIMMSTLLVVGCTKQNEEADLDETVVGKEQVLISHENDYEPQEGIIKESESEAETEIESEEESEEVETANIYERFLNGEEKLYFHDYAHVYNETVIFDSTKGYNLNEMIDAFVKEYYMIDSRPTISYSYLDLGNDGVEELAVRFWGMGIYAPEDDSELIYIIKEKDGMLELCFCYENWARSQASINRSGYYVSGGSNSATSYLVECGYIDGDGVYHYICATESEADITNLSWDPDIGSAAQKISARVSDGEEPFSLISIRFDEMVTVDDYYNISSYYTFEPTGTERDNVYREVFEEEGLTLYEYGELQQMIKDIEMELGITPEIKMDAVLEWIACE